MIVATIINMNRGKKRPIDLQYFNPYEKSKGNAGATEVESMADLKKFFVSK